jgi:hypothetical protein
VSSGDAVRRLTGTIVVVRSRDVAWLSAHYTKRV